jgi:hemolysin activation/secretion protein
VPSRPVQLIRTSFAALSVLLLGLHAQAQQAAADAPRFDILEFVVEGDTLLGPAAIERAVYGFLGPGRGVADAENARKALEAAYQAAGFLSVNVLLPPQTVGASGEVRLQVVQAPVERLRVLGAEHVRPSRLREAVPSLAPGNVPNFNDLQQELGALARANQNIEVTPVLAAGSTSGTMAAELKLQDRLPLHGQVELNNKTSLDTVAGRVEAQLSYDDLFQRRHSAALNWVYSPRRPSQADILTASYALPFGWGPGGEGDRLSLAWTHADTDTPTAVGGATVSRGNTWRLRWRDQLAAPEGLGHGLSWGLTVRHLRDRSLLAGGAELGAPELRYTTLALGYDLMVNGQTPGRFSSLQAEWTVSPAGLNRRHVDCFGQQREQFACKRVLAEPRFQTLSFTLSHREPFGPGGRWSLLARLQGLLADTPLVSSEQIVFGGQDSVRGYYEGEQAADTGAALRLELGSPAWAPLEAWSASGLAFIDTAYGKRLYAQGGEVASPRLASSGLGLKLESRFGLQASLTWVRVLLQTTRLVEGQQRPASGSDAERAQRWDFNLRQSF